MDCAIGQTIPDFVVSQNRNAHIAAKRESSTIGIDGHVRTVNLAIARIEDVATLVFQAVSFHPPDWPNRGSFLRSSAHFVQTAPGSSPGLRNLFAITP